MTPWSPPPQGGPYWQLPADRDQGAATPRLLIAVLVVIALGWGVLVLPFVLFLTYGGDWSGPNAEQARQAYIDAVSGQTWFAVAYWVAAIPLGLTTIMGERLLAAILLGLSILGLGLAALAFLAPFGVTVGTAQLPPGAVGNVLMVPTYGLLAAAAAYGLVRRRRTHGVG